VLAKNVARRRNAHYAILICIQKIQRTIKVNTVGVDIRNLLFFYVSVIISAMVYFINKVQYYYFIECTVYEKAGHVNHAMPVRHKNLY
jgi:hypothetical protein